MVTAPTGTSVIAILRVRRAIWLGGEVILVVTLSHTRPDAILAAAAVRAKFVLILLETERMIVVCGCIKWVGKQLVEIARQ